MTSTALLAIPIVLPLVAAGVSLLLSSYPIAQRILAATVLVAVLVDAAVLLVVVDHSGPQVLHGGGWQPPLGITIVADRFSALALLVAIVVCLTVLVYAIGQGSAEQRIENVPSVFHPTYLVLLAGIALVFLTGDLFTLFVGFEVMLMASYVLSTLGPTVERVRAGMTYVVTSLTASILLLTSIGLVYSVTGTLNLAQLAEAVPALTEGMHQFLGLLLLVALGIKAAVVPLHWWLPDSYPATPAATTAIFAALLTKVAVYAIVRTQTLLFPREEPWNLLLVVAAATMLLGILGALAQNGINRVLSFTLVAHIGFMIFGLAVFSAAGLAGTILYLVHHIVVQAALFLVCGLVEHKRGTASLGRLGGLAGTAPLTAALFLVPALSVSGFPPLAGFVAKLALLQAALADPTPLVLTTAAIAVVTSLLTLAAMARLWSIVFWGEKPADPVTHRSATGSATTQAPARLMVAAATVAVLAGLTVAAVAGPLSAFADRAATDLLDANRYRIAVLGTGDTP